MDSLEEDKEIATVVVQWGSLLPIEWIQRHDISNSFDQFCRQCLVNIAMNSGRRASLFSYLQFGGLFVVIMFDIFGIDH